MSQNRRSQTDSIIEIVLSISLANSNLLISPRCSNILALFTGLCLPVVQGFPHILLCATSRSVAHTREHVYRLLFAPVTFYNGMRPSFIKIVHSFCRNSHVILWHWQVAVTWGGAGCKCLQYVFVWVFFGER